MSALQGRFIVLGVTGSIAAYKSVELARRLTQAGALFQRSRQGGVQQGVLRVCSGLFSVPSLSYVLNQPGEPGLINPDQAALFAADRPQIDLRGGQQPLGVGQAHAIDTGRRAATVAADQPRGVEQDGARHVRPSPA